MGGSNRGERMDGREVGGRKVGRVERKGGREGGRE